MSPHKHRQLRQRQNRFRKYLRFDGDLWQGFRYESLRYIVASHFA